MATLVRSVRQKVRPAAFRIRRPAVAAPGTPLTQLQDRDLPLPDLSSLILYGQA